MIDKKMNVSTTTTLAAAVLLALTSSAQAIVIMPVGDSTTAGDGSDSYGGYRLYLQELLHAAGAEYDFVGTQTHGPDFLGAYPTVPFLNEHEDYPGQRIAQIRTHLQNAPAYPEGRTPDVILLMM